MFKLTFAFQNFPNTNKNFTNPSIFKGHLRLNPDTLFKCIPHKTHADSAFVTHTN